MTTFSLLRKTALGPLPVAALLLTAPFGAQAQDKKPDAKHITAPEAAY